MCGAGVGPRGPGGTRLGGRPPPQPLGLPADDQTSGRHKNPKEDNGRPRLAHAASIPFSVGSVPDSSPQSQTLGSLVRAKAEGDRPAEDASLLRVATVGVSRPRPERPGGVRSIVDVDCFDAVKYCSDLEKRAIGLKPRQTGISAQAKRLPAKSICQVINPNAPAKLLWDALGLVLVLYLAMSLPFEMAFNVTIADHSQFVAVLEEVITVFFIVDLVFGFVTGYVDDQNGVLVTAPVSIARRYLRTWFFPDLLASFPYSWVMQGATNAPKLLRVNRVLRLARFARMFRLAKAFALVERWSAHFDPQAVELLTVLTKLVVMIFVVLGHWCACLWHFVGTLGTRSETLIECRPEEFLHACRWVEAFFPEGEQVSIGRRYLVSLYFSVGTMSGVGSVVEPRSPTEEVICLIYSFMAVGIFAHASASLTSLFAAASARAADARRRLHRITTYMRSRYVPRELQFRVRRYVKHVLENESVTQVDHSLTDTLSASLKMELTAVVRGSILRTAQIFVRSPESLVQKLVVLCETEVHGVGDFLAEQGEDAHGMIFLVSGTAVAYTTEDAIAAVAAQSRTWSHQPTAESPVQTHDNSPAPGAKGLLAATWSGRHAMRVQGKKEPRGAPEQGETKPRKPDLCDRWKKCTPPRNAVPISAGCHFGEVCLFLQAQSRRQANVRTVEGPAEIVFLPRSKFQDYMLEHEDWTSQHFMEMSEQVAAGNLSVLGFRCIGCGACHDISRKCPTSAGKVGPPLSLGQEPPPGAAQGATMSLSFLSKKSWDRSELGSPLRH